MEHGACSAPRSLSPAPGAQQDYAKRAAALDRREAELYLRCRVWKQSLQRAPLAEPGPGRAAGLCEARGGAGPARGGAALEV